jgi:hypothetical protein|tara:strand:+ start:1196 stop:1369 length:174 start_codon:yes stop_codon:yes gene_type:complete
MLVKIRKTSVAVKLLKKNQNGKIQTRLPNGKFAWYKKEELKEVKPFWQVLIEEQCIV